MTRSNRDRSRWSPSFWWRAGVTFILSFLMWIEAAPFESTKPGWWDGGMAYVGLIGLALTAVALLVMALSDSIADLRRMYLRYRDSKTAEGDT